MRLLTKPYVKFHGHVLVGQEVAKSRKIRVVDNDGRLIVGKGYDPPWTSA